MERAQLSEGALLALRTGRGAWHAEAIGADELEHGQADTEFRGVLFWVNLARKDKEAEPSAQVVQPEQIPVRHEGDATVRVLVGEDSPVRLGTPALILDVHLPTGGEVTTPVSPEFQGFAYLLEGEAAFGANRRRAKPPRSSSSVAVMSSGSPMPPPALDTCSWRGSRMGRHLSSTGRTWTRSRPALPEVTRCSASTRESPRLPTAPRSGSFSPSQFFSDYAMRPTRITWPLP